MKKYLKPITARRLLLLLLPVFWLILFNMAENFLLRGGYLNKKDLGFVGGESGTAWEYLTNVWHWDAFGFLVLALLVGIALITLVRIVLATLHGSNPDKEVSVPDSSLS